MADDALKLKINVEMKNGNAAIKTLEKLNEKIASSTKLAKELTEAFAAFGKMTKSLDTLASATKTFSSAFKEVSGTTKTSVASFDKLSKTLNSLEQNQAKLKIQEEKLNQEKLKTLDLTNKEVISHEKAIREKEKSAIAIEKMKNKHAELTGVYDQQKLQLKRLEVGLREFVASGNANKSTLISLGNEYKNLQAKIKDTDNKFKELTTTQEKAKKSSFSLKIAMANFLALQVDRIVSNIGYSMLEFAKSCSKAGIELDALKNTFMAATGGWRQGQQEMSWLIGMSNKLGVAFGDVSDSYAKFMTSFTRSGGTIQQSRQIFEDLSTAMVSLHLPAERMQGVFIALEQMANKGTVQAEELKRQLGNALPGAFELAAESMGILPKQLMDMMKKGEVFSKDFLPAFAATVKDALGQSIGIAAEQFNANMNRLKTATDLFKMSLGQLMNLALLPFIKMLVPLMNTLAQATESFNKFSQAVFMSNSAEQYMGMSAQIVQLTKSIAGLNLENEESRKIFEENAAILPKLSQYILELNKNFVDLSDAELKHIASMGQAEAMEQILAARTKELSSWQNTLQATWNVVWTNIRNITVGVVKSIWEALKILGQAINKWFNDNFGWAINFYKQIGTSIKMLKGEMDYKRGFKSEEYKKGLFDDFKNAIQSEKNYIALNKTAKAMNALGESTKNTYAALKMAQISARGLSDEISGKKSKSSSRAYKKTEAENEFSKLRREKSALEAKSATGGLTDAEKERYKELTSLIKGNKVALKELAASESEIFDLKQKKISQLENEIKLGLYQGKNVEKLVSEYNLEKLKMEEVDDAFNQLTGDLQDGWKREEAQLKRLRAEYKYMVTHVNKFTDAQREQVKASLKSQEALSAYAKTMAELEKPAEITKRHAKDLGKNLVDGLLDVVEGSKTFWEAFAEIGKTTLKNYASDMMKNFLDKAVASFAYGNANGGIKVGLGTMFSSIFGMGISKDDNRDGGSLFSSLTKGAENLSTVLTGQTGTALSETINGLTSLDQKAQSTASSVVNMGNPVLNTAQSLMGMAYTTPAVTASMTAFGATMTTVTPMLIPAATALATMAASMTMLAKSTSVAASSMAAYAVAASAASVASIPIAGAALAPVAALATGAAIAAGTLMTGASIGASSAMAGIGSGIGSAASGIGSGIGGFASKLGGGKIIPHAKGGVVSSPTTFPMGGGNIGLAGEAGTEVIAPARRMSNGEIGVGAVQPKVTVNNYTNAAVEVIKRPDNEMEIKINELNAMLSSSRTNKGMASAQSRMSSRGKRIG